MRIVGPLYTAAQRVDIFRKFPEWSPQRHMALDAIQRAAVRDLLALSIALNATLIMPPFTCTCDRYWGFLQNCRMPTAPQDMPLPYRCSQDALFEIKYWNDKQVRAPSAQTREARHTRRAIRDAPYAARDKLHPTCRAQVRFREADFLDHPSVPAAIKEAAVRVVVHQTAPVPPAGSAEARFTTTLRPGVPMIDVPRAVAAANPQARLIEIGAADLGRLCKYATATATAAARHATTTTTTITAIPATPPPLPPRHHRPPARLSPSPPFLLRWLGSTRANRDFNNLARYVLHESSRYCPSEDNHESVINTPHWNWQDPFTAYNCTWGFATPADYPEPAETEPQPCGRGAAGVALVERPNSTTCARAMLCGIHVEPGGRPSMPLEKASRCNLEGCASRWRCSRTQLAPHARQPGAQHTDRSAQRMSAHQREMGGARERR